MRRRFAYKGRHYHVVVQRLSPRIYLVVSRGRKPQTPYERAARKAFPDGSIVVTRRQKGKIITQVHRSLFRAIRGRVNIARRYGRSDARGERAQMKEMLESGRATLKLILGRRASELEEEIVTAKLEKIYLGLDGTRSFWKETAYEAVCAAMSPFDSLGRFNPGVRGNYLSTGTHGLEMRAVEIPQILPFIDFDLIVLMKERDRLLAICQEESAKYQQVLNSWIFRNPDADTAYLSKNFAGWVDKRERAIDPLVIMPFTRTAYHIKKDLAEAREFGAKSNWPAVERILKRIVASLKLRLFQPEIEKQVARLNMILEALKDKEDDRVNYLVIDWSHGVSSDIAVIRNEIRQNCSDRDFRNPVVRPLLTRLGNVSNLVYEKNWLEAKEETKAASALI